MKPREVQKLFCPSNARLSGKNTLMASVGMNRDLTSLETALKIMVNSQISIESFAVGLFLLKYFFAITVVNGFSHLMGHLL